MAPENCYCHRDVRDNQDLSLMTVTMQCMTLQTAGKPLWQQQLQNAARGLGYRLRALTTKPPNSKGGGHCCCVRMWDKVLGLGSLWYCLGYWFCLADGHIRKGSFFPIT